MNHLVGARHRTVRPSPIATIRTSVTLSILVILLAVNVTTLTTTTTTSTIISTNSSSKQEEACPLTSSLQLSQRLPAHSVTTLAGHGQANVFFTVLLPQLDCQSDALQRRDTLIYLNAISYALDLLNGEQLKAHTADGHSSIKQYLPLLHRTPTVWSAGQQPLRFGARLVTVARSADDGAAVTSSPTTLTCTPKDSASDAIHDLAFLDAAHLFDKHANNALLEQIPIISLSSKESILTTSFKANLIVNLLDTLNWKHFAIITTRHEDSLYIVKILGQIAHSGHVCISDIFEWTKGNDGLSNGDGDDDEHLSADKVNTEERLGHFLKSVYRANTKIPILIVSNDEAQVSQLVQMLYKSFPSEIANHQLFFSLVPSPELLSQLQLLSNWGRVFTLTSHLPDIPQASGNLLSNLEACKADDEASEAIANSDMWRKWLSFLPIRSMLSLAMALDNALKNTCGNVVVAATTNSAHNDSSSKNGQKQMPWCDDLGKLDRKVFFNYLSELEDKIESTWMTVGAIDTSGRFNDLLLYNGDEFRVMKSNYSVEESTCVSSDCNSCIKFRQSRNDDQHEHAGGNLNENNVRHLYGINKLFADGDAGGGHDGHNNLHILLNEEESSAVPVEEADEESAVLHVETHEINLGLLLPLHQNGASILECSTELNLPAYYIYEAARWIIDKINQNNYLIPGIEIKLELIDTCSSPFYATQELAHLTSSEAKVQPIAFVSSLPRDHYKQVVDFVSSINYTLIATQDISFMDLKFGSRYGILQTSATSQNLIRALVEQLKYFGWRYISVVVDPNDLYSMSMLHYLNELTNSEKICFASVEELSDQHVNVTMMHLLENYKNGANVVVLLTSYESTANLMAYYQSTVKLGVLKNENLHFVAIRDQNLEMVHGFEEEYLGSIFIRESIGRMSHFDNHFLDLLANPKKDQLLYQFINQCGPNSAQCLRLINSFDRTVAANSMQAILAIVGGFARMRNETCADEQGICNKMLESNFHRSLLSYILNTRSMRIDSQSDRRFRSDNYDVFEFSPDGSSGRDVEILNFKHDFNNGLFRFDTVALYVHNTKTLMRNPNVRYIFYKYNGVVNGHKEYNETELITSDCVNLKKCSQCQPQTPEFIYMPSWDNLILTGIFNVHLHSEQNPLICQKNFTLVDSVQNVEAFLWTIDLINNDPHVLPGVHLGALIFDSCNSYQKIYRDISNFLSNSLLLGDSNVQIPMADSVMGFVVDGKNTKIVDSILDLTSPLKISVLTTEARESKYNDLRHYPQFLGFSLPNKFHVDAIFNILRNYSWTFVSAVYENNLNEQQYSDAFDYFSNNAEKYGVRLAAQELFDESNLVESVANLKSMANLGARVVVLFLSPENLRNFLYFNEMVKGDEQSKLLPSDVLYIVIDSQNVLQIFSHLNITAISVSQDRKIVPEFQEHFLDLSLQTNVKNPWFTRLWEKVYGCEGFGCYRTSGSLRQRNVTINEKTGAIINSVYTLAHSLELTRQSLCPNTFNGLCRNFVSHLRQVSKMEHDSVKENEFVGLDGSRIAFDHDSNYITGHLNVLNWQQVDKSGTRAWIQVGHFDAENGLLMASSKTRAYLAHGSAAGITFSKVVSQCAASNSKCSKVNGENGGSVGPTLPPFMGATEEARANIALVVPLHETDSNSKCGPINSEMFEKLMAFQFALDQSPVHLGVIVLDSCSYSKQHLQQLASAHNYKLLPKIVSIVNLLEANHLNLTISNQLFNMIGDYSPLVYNLFRAKTAQDSGRQSFFFNEKSTANENANHILRSIVDLCSRSKWPVVNLVYSNEFSKNYFLFEANQNNICVDKTMSVTLKDIAKPQFRSDWANFTASLDSQITVVLTNSDLIEYLIKYSDKDTLDSIVWVGDKNLKTGADNVQKSLKKSFQMMVTVRKAATSIDSMPVASVIDGLSSYFDVNNANARSRSKAVTNWLYEYWHRKFNCLLNAKKQEKACFEVKNARKALSNTQELKHVIDFAQVLSKSISKFVTGKCNSTSDDCIYNVQLRNELKNSLIDDLNKNNYLNDIRKVNAESNYQVEVATNHGATVNTFTSFNLMNVSNLVATNLSDGQSVPVSAACRSSCDYCRTQLLQSRNRSNHLLSSDSLQSPLTSNMSAHRTWAIAASIFSTLGLIVVLICVLYFILIFPIALGTTIIGYQILVGLFLCYLANFAYLLPSTNSLCWVREFGLPIAYCVILSGLFVKVYNYWCQVLMKKSTKPLAYNSPMTLLSISFLFVVIQVCLTAFLTYKYPGNYSAFANTLQCSANTKFALFRPETALPLLLLALLFVLTIFFSVKTIDNLESRWILICSTLGALTWLAWVGFDILYRDAKPISIVVANIIVATLYIVLLYIRKLYLFSKISRKILKERRVNMDANLQYEPFAEYQQQQQYGAFRSCTENISWSNIQDKANYRNATRSPFEGDTEGDNVSSCGSVKSNGSSQVQCQELYPMEVYDNAGQNQLANARVSQSTRSIYDIIDDASFK